MPPPPPIDGVEYKLGVSLRLISHDMPAGCTEALGEREMTSTSLVVRRAVAELYQQATAQAAADATGHGPSSTARDFRQVRGAKGIAYAPIMTIIDWKKPASTLDTFSTKNL